MTPQKIGAIAAALSLAADQAVKNFLLYGWGFLHYAPGQRVEVLPFFDLVMVWNRGVSYGLFQAGDWKGTALLSVLATVLIGALTWWLMRAERGILGLGIGLMIGGALGNVTDRVVYGAVADFFRFYAFGYDWYVFNVADAAITLGVVALLADAVFYDRPKDAA